MSKRMNLLLLALLVVAGFLVYAESETKLFSDSIGGTQKVMLPLGVTYEYGFDSKTAYGRGAKGFICATGDGAAFYNYKGAAIWRETFTMNQPYIINDGDMFAIFEPMGRKVYVCNSRGILYTALSEAPILGGGINSLGSLLLILRKDDGTYRIPLYNTSGEEVSFAISEIDGVFPISVDISEDGLMYAVGYIDATKASVLSRTLYTYTMEGSEFFSQNTDRPFKAIEQEGSVISKIRFFKDNNLMISTDDEILITNGEGEEIFRLRPQNRIKSSDFFGDMFGIVMGEALPNATEPELTGTARWYFEDGRMAGEFLADSVDTIKVFEDLVLLKNEHSYYCVDKSGRILWTIAASKDIIGIMPIDKKTALVVKVNYAELYGLKTPPKES